MHYWTPVTKDVFLAALEADAKASGETWRVVRSEASSWMITLPASRAAVSLTPGEFVKRKIEY